MTTSVEARDALGRFGPGNGGRKPGSRNKRSRAALEAVQSLDSLAIAGLRERLEQQDMAAIKFVLEYCLPRGGRTIDLGSTEPSAVADAACMGEISPDEAARLAQSLKTLSDAQEVRDLKHQLDELERIVAELRIK